MNRVLTLLKSNREILLEVIPTLKFQDLGVGHCIAVVTPAQFHNLYSGLTMKGYNPYMLMSWSATEPQLQD